MADHSKPTLTSTYPNFVTELDARLDDLALMLDPTKTTVTNRPVGAIRWNDDTRRFERWTGLAWAELVLKTGSEPYDIRTFQADDVWLGPAGASPATAKGNGQIGRAARSSGLNDANDYVESGVWYVTTTDAVSNFPTANRAGFLHVYARYDAGILRQVWYDATSQAIVRTRISVDSGSTWTGWWNVTANADWNATSGESFIQNKPTLGTAAAAAIQTSTTDTTSGRVLTVGAFGLGASPPAVSAAGALDAIGYTCFVAVLGTNRAAVGGPPGSSAGIVFTTGTASYAGQFWLGRDSVNEFWIRSCSNSVWSPWRRVYDAGSILGTVSQASGVPTGAIIERGASSTGEYVRFADGTQICHFNYTETDGAVTAAGSVFRSTTPYTWVFPAAFSTITNLSLFATMQAANVGWANARAVSTGSAEIIKWVPVTEAALRVIRVVAIGRWV